MTPPVRLTLLGTPGITGGSRDPGRPAFQGQALALLSVLAWAGDRGIAREKLFVLFWPEVARLRSEAGQGTGVALALGGTVVASAGNLYSQRLFGAGGRYVRSS